IIGSYYNIKNNQGLGPFGILFITFSIIILIFTFCHYFISDRYSAPLAILCIPLITFGMSRLSDQRRLAAHLVTALLILNVFDNIMSTGDQSTHITRAGHWLKEHQLPEQETYIDYARIAYQ